MTILIGLLVRHHRATGSQYVKRELYEAPDIHEARARLRQVRGLHERNLWHNDIFKAQLHDTQTHRTWTINDDGISRKDYRYEATDRFRRKWHGWSA